MVDGAGNPVTVPVGFTGTAVSGTGSPQITTEGSAGGTCFITLTLTANLTPKLDPCTGRLPPAASRLAHGGTHHRCIIAESPPLCSPIFKL